MQHTSISFIQFELWMGTREAPAPPALTLPCYCQWDRLALVYLVGVAGRTLVEGDTSDATGRRLKLTIRRRPRAKP